MQITKVVPAAKTAGRYNIYVDGEYSFSLDEYQLVQAGIHSGMTIDEERLAALKNESDYGKNYIRAIDLISRRLRSEKEIRDYGRRKGWTEVNIERVIARLKDHGYLNDLLFTEAFVRSRQNRQRYSKKRIEQDLIKKGVSKDVIRQVLTDDQPDNDALDKLVAKRIHRYEDINKLKAYLLRAGFNYEDITSAIDRYLSSQNKNDS